MATEQQLIPLHVLYIEGVDVLLALAKAVKHFACDHCMRGMRVVAERQVARVKREE